MNFIPKNIIISRTDSIGDVVLTLPVATVLKEYFPDIKIGFMGKAYTAPVIKACKNVDEFIDINDFLNGTVTVAGEKPEAILHVFPVRSIALRAKRLKIPLRIGTTNRLYHWLTCNKLVRLSRKNSDLHEAQLNLKLLETFNITRSFLLAEIGKLFAMQKIQPLPQKLASLINEHKYNLILHPKSQGNGREWGLENYAQLINLLDTDKFKIFISGVENERKSLQPLFNAAKEKITDITGIMNLDEFISFIAAADGIVASGTGPVHLAAALGKDAFGIYPPIRPVHPGRWAPLGAKAHVFVANKTCNDCKGNAMTCHCINEITPLWLKTEIDKAAEIKE